MSGINLTRDLRTAYFSFVIGLFALCIYATSAQGASRIKDISDFEGIRDNLLVGYGLVVGLNNTGDTLANGHFTKQSLLAMCNHHLNHKKV